MKELSNLWQSFALTGNPKQYLKFKQQEKGLNVHDENKSQGHSPAGI